jgi:hypothetical protein
VYPLSSEGCIKNRSRTGGKRAGTPLRYPAEAGRSERKYHESGKNISAYLRAGSGGQFCFDIRRREILPVFTCLAAGAGALWKLAVLKCGLGPLLLSLIPGVLSAVLSFLTDEDIGYGDAILIAAAGIWCGSPLIWFLIGVAMIVAAAAAAFLLLRKFFRSRKIAGPAASHRSETAACPFLVRSGYSVPVIRVIL